MALWAISCVDTKLILGWPNESQISEESTPRGARRQTAIVTFPPDPLHQSKEPESPSSDAEAAKTWTNAELPRSEVLWDDPAFQDGLRNLELLDQARNLRLRMEADLGHAWAAGPRQDRAKEWSYLQRAIWNLRGGHRLQM